MKVTKAELIKVARHEIQEWNLPPGLVLAILFCFIERVITGQKFEDIYMKPPLPAIDYEI